MFPGLTQCDIKAAIRDRRKAERKWRANKSPEDFVAFKIKKNYVTKLMNSARSTYYSNFIRDNSTNQRKLLRAAKSLLFEPKTLSLPEGTGILAHANDVGEFFVQKIKDIHSKLDTSSPSFSTADCTISRSADVSLTEFDTLSVDKVRKLISRSAKKSSRLDPMPTSLVVQCLDELLPVITAIINMSLKSGHFADKWKEAIVTPYLKNPGPKFCLRISALSAIWPLYPS